MIDIYGIDREFIDPILWACIELSIDTAILIFDQEIEDDYHGEITDYHKTQFEISLNQNMTLDETLIAIFHELVHVKQVLDGKLSFECGPTVWEGNTYVEPSTYSDLPWEKEAFDLEKILFSKYVQTT